jgi:transcriptional regulator with XRE-family HTH domain
MPPLGSRIATTRQFRGFSQHQLSERSGVPQSQISKLENGHSEDPTLSAVVALAKALEVSLAALAAPDGDALLEELSQSVLPPEQVVVDEYDPRTEAQAYLEKVGNAQFANDCMRWVASNRTILVSGATGTGKLPWSSTSPV